MRLFVLQMDDRLMEDESIPSPSPDAVTRVQFTQENQEIAARRGWGYRMRTTGHEDKPPWWRKVFAIQDLLMDDPDPDQLLVMWLDSDARMTACTGMDPMQLVVINPGICMWISPDAPPSLVPFNAGAFLLRGTRYGRALIQRWCSQYDPTIWVRVPTKPRLLTGNAVRLGLDRQSQNQPLRWQHTVGQWAGVAYEQGSFIRHILPMAQEYGIRRMPYYVFNEIDCTQPHRDSMVVHLYGRNADRVCTQAEQRCVLRIVHWKPWWWMLEDKKWLLFGVLIVIVLVSSYCRARPSAA